MKASRLMRAPGFWRAWSASARFTLWLTGLFAGPGRRRVRR